MSEGRQVLSYSQGAAVPVRRGPLLAAFGLLFFVPMAWIGIGVLDFLVLGIDLSSGITWNRILTMGVEVAAALGVAAAIVLFARAVSDLPPHPGRPTRRWSRLLIAMALLVSMLGVAETVCMAEANTFMASAKPISYRMAQWISLAAAVPESILLVAAWVYMRRITRLLRHRWFVWATHAFWFFMTFAFLLNAASKFLDAISPTFSDGTPTVGLMISYISWRLTLVALLVYFAYWPVAAVLFARSAQRPQVAG